MDSEEGWYKKNNVFNGNDEFAIQSYFSWHFPSPTIQDPLNKSLVVHGGCCCCCCCCCCCSQRLTWQRAWNFRWFGDAFEKMWNGVILGILFWTDRAAHLVNYGFVGAKHRQNVVILELYRHSPPLHFVLKRQSLSDLVDKSSNIVNICCSQ